ncbi:MAG: dihydroneopterin aldolase [Thermoanaerobaculia bacterium]
MSRDKIIIKDLLVRGIIGMNDWERQKSQDILVNLTVEYDLGPAGESDEVTDTLNYRSLTKAVIAYCETSSHFLVEKLAAQVARICVVDFGAASVVVRIEKPGALRFASSVGVEIQRTLADFN